MTNEYKKYMNGFTSLMKDVYGNSCIELFEKIKNLSDEKMVEVYNEQKDWYMKMFISTYQKRKLLKQ